MSGRFARVRGGAEGVIEEILPIPAGPGRRITRVLLWPYGPRDRYPLCVYAHGERCDWVQPFGKGDAVAVRFRPFTQKMRQTATGNVIPMGSNTLLRIRPLFPDEIKRYEREDAEDAPVDAGADRLGRREEWGAPWNG